MLTGCLITTKDTTFVILTHLTLFSWNSENMGLLLHIYFFFVSALLTDCSLCWDLWNGKWHLHLTRPCIVALGWVLILVEHQILAASKEDPAFCIGNCNIAFWLLNDRYTILRRDSNPPRQSEVCYQTTALPPSHHGWVTYLLILSQNISFFLKWWNNTCFALPRSHKTVSGNKLLLEKKNYESKLQIYFWNEEKFLHQILPARSIRVMYFPTTKWVLPKAFAG